MDHIAFALSLLANFAGLIIIIFGRRYLLTYINEKAKNAATKEDIEIITTKIEIIKTNYLIELEKAKHEYELKGNLIERKRAIYEKISSSLRIFISGQGLSPEIEKQKKEDFFNSYSCAWLWSSDEVLHALHKFVDMEAAATQNPKTRNIPELKKAYTAIMVAMRKDCGFFETSVENYQFLKFVN